MISQREKGVYLAFCGAQITLAAPLFGLFYVGNDFLRVGAVEGGGVDLGQHRADSCTGAARWKP